MTRKSAIIVSWKQKLSSNAVAQTKTIDTQVHDSMCAWERERERRRKRKRQTERGEIWELCQHAFKNLRNKFSRETQETRKLQFFPCFLSPEDTAIKNIYKWERGSSPSPEGTDTLITHFPVLELQGRNACSVNNPKHGNLL